MTPAQALRSATMTAAELLGMQDKIGSVEAGKYADIVAVPGDPLADIQPTGEGELRDEGRRGLRKAVARFQRIGICGAASRGISPVTRGSSSISIARLYGTKPAFV